MSGAAVTGCHARGTPEVKKHILIEIKSEHIKNSNGNSNSISLMSSDQFSTENTHCQNHKLYIKTGNTSSNLHFFYCPPEGDSSGSRMASYCKDISEVMTQLFI